jgi:hypothetical protein
MGGGAAAGGDFDAVLANKQDAGWRGLYRNKRCLGLALFASLGGVLYGKLYTGLVGGSMPCTRLHEAVFAFDRSSLLIRHGTTC